MGQYYADWDANEVNDGLAVYYKRAYQEGSHIIAVKEEFASGITAIRKEPRASYYTGNDYTLNVLSNGKFEGNDGWQVPTKILTTVVPSFFVPENGHALVIGLGTGHSTKVTHALGYQTKLCEISQAKIDMAAEYFSTLHEGTITSGVMEVVQEDGRQCVLQASHAYDLITADIGSLWGAGASNLYTQEFYRQIHAALSEEGVFSKQIQPGNMNPALLRSQLATLRSVFPHVAIARIHNKLFTVMASKSPITQRTEALERYKQAAGLKNERKEVAPIIRTYANNWLLLNANGVDALIAEGPYQIYTDANQLLEFLSPRMRDADAEATRGYIRTFARPR